MHLLKNSRFYVLTGSIIFSVIIYGAVVVDIPRGELQNIRLNEIYGLLSVLYLYFALLAGPFCYTFSNFPLKKQYTHMRRAIGVSAFYFALLHSLFAFFGELGGFNGLGFLSTKYLIAVGFSFVALFILMILAALSFDAVIRKISFPRWKFLQRFVYVAGILILVHMVMLGTHFQELFGYVSQITFIALVFLLFLEAPRVDALIQKKTGLEAKFGITAILVSGIFISGILFSLLPSSQKDVSFNIHSQHALAQSQQAIDPSLLKRYPSMQGDTSLRYSVGFIKPDTVPPNQDTTFQFPVYNAANGNQVRLFQKVFTKDAHLIIVNNELNYFAHIHPDLSGNIFSVTTQFPQPGLYRMYLSYQPGGAIEQQVGFSVRVGVGEDQGVGYSDQAVDKQLTKQYDKYEVTLAHETPFSAEAMSTGQQFLDFTIRDAKTKKGVTTLKPYLMAFGHLVMIQEENYSYLHVHPTKLALHENDIGGPTVSFVPLSLTNVIEPGIYRIFAEFYPDGQRVVAEYTIRVIK